VVAACLAAVGVLGLAAPASAAAPKRPSARCRDGSVSYATSARVACWGHGGVGRWLRVVLPASNRAR